MSPPRSVPSDGPRETPSIVRKIYVCYFLSGALGLTYQILWLRKLLLVFGSTVHAVSTVLTVFFGGLALGSWLLGRLIDRHEASGLRWYALLEAGVGLYAFVTLPLFDAIHHVYIPVYRASGFSPLVLVGWSFVCSVAILLIPTTLMGGTFPVLSRFLIRSKSERGATIASLYGINTAGAMVGTLGVYFFGLPFLGLSRTLWCAGILNLGVGGLCAVFDHRLTQLGFVAPSRAGSSRSSPTPHEPLGALRWLFLAFGLSGFSAMVYEVAWTRALSLIVGSSIYAFCIILATFLGGLALGSLWVQHHLSTRAATVQSFVFIEGLLGSYGLVSIVLLPQLPNWFVVLWPLTGGSFAGLLWLQCTLSMFAMIFPTLMMGALFPVVSEFVTGQVSQLGQRLGSVYAINTMGGILGAFLSGFVLIPLFGLPRAILVSAMVNCLAGAVVYVHFGRSGSSRWRQDLSTAILMGVFALGILVVIPAWQRQVLAEGAYLQPNVYQHESVEQIASRATLLYYRDSLNATVSVHQQGDELYLKVGGKTDASNGLDMATQILSAHLPLLLHPNPKAVLVIGLGSGVTLGHAGRYPVSTLHCAEIDPAVIEGARWFQRYNYQIHDDPRVRIFPADGRNFLLASPQRYDVIISEPSNPWMAGIAYLFTREFYHLAKQRLAPGGIMCQWLQLYRIFPTDVKLLLKTFHAEFPYVSVWSSIPGDLLVIGSLTPQQLDYGRLTERMAAPAIQKSLEGIQVRRPENLLQTFLFDTTGLEQLTADVSWLHEDDQPWIEFDAPKALYADRAFSVNYEGLEQFKSGPQVIIQGYQPKEDDRELSYALASFWSYRGEPQKAQHVLEQALRHEAMSSETWMRLSQLYLQGNELLKAEVALTKAISLDSKSSGAYHLLARLNWQQHRLEEATRLYERTARLQVPDGLLAQEMGDCLREAGQLARAAEYYRSALSQVGDRQAAELIFTYVQTLKELRVWQTTEQLCRVGMHVFPGRAASFSLLLGETLLAQHRPRDAEPWFRRSLTLAPDDPAAYYGLGRIALEQGQIREAIQYVKRGLQSNPYHRPSLQLLQQLQPKT